jgi:hypothetical protein
MVYEVKDLSPEQRHAAEILLGHPVSEDEAVSIKAIPLGTVIPSRLTPEERIEALRKLNAYFDRIDAKRQPVSEEEEDAIVTEAIRSVRPNYRPIR